MTYQLAKLKNRHAGFAACTMRRAAPRRAAPRRAVQFAAVFRCFTNTKISWPAAMCSGN